MKIFISWIRKAEKFDQFRHTCSPMRLLRLEIFQKEGEIAQACLELPAQDVDKIDDSWAWISVSMNDKIHPLFLGKRTPTVHYKSEYIALVTLVSLPENWQEQIQAHKADRSLDFPKFEGEVEQDLLEDFPCVWHFHPVKHEVQVNDLHKGCSILSIHKEILFNSFGEKISFYPYEAIDVEVIAEWVQEMEGTINFFPLISEMFSERIVNTLTPHNLIQTWPRQGTWMKRSGYFIGKSYLEIHPPPATGGLNLYPTTTKEIMIQDKPYRFQRYWLQGTLEVMWQYRQKRRQKVSFTVKHEHQHSGWGKGEVKKLTFKVAPEVLKESDRAMVSFFQTSLGQKAIIKAMRKAHCYLAASARNIRFNWRMPFSGLVTVDQEIHFTHPQQHRTYQGKCIEYRHIFTPSSWITDLTVATTAGIKEVSLPQEVEIIPLESPQGMIQEDELTAKDFIDFLHITHGPQEQINQLTDAGTFHVAPTQIHLRLKDLRSKPCLVQTLTVKTPLVWSGVNQFSPPQL